MRARVSVLLIFVCLAAVLAIAQERGAIIIKVVDNNGAAVTGALVKLLDYTTRTCATNPRGECRFDGVSAGTYPLQVELPGFITSIQMVTVNTNQAVTITTKLERTRADRPAAPSAVEEFRAQSLRMLEVQGGVVGGGGVAAGSYLMAETAQDAWYYRQPRNTESYSDSGENPFRAVSADPLSTFSIDVDTASYTNMRRFLNGGNLPPTEAIRIEELINYFHYSYPQPKGDQPFSITTELAECPWDTTHRLALIGLQGKEIDNSDVPPRNLVFLIDVSGSMMSPDKLPLVRSAMRMLAETLRANDRVAIVVYAGNSGLVLPSTAGSGKERIIQAIERLEAGGSTNGGAGIRLAYQIGRENFIKSGVNRVILATDGDFNVGTVDQKDLERLIEHERASGVFLSVLGVGTGNLKDSTMEMLADKGNGNYSYLDSMHEAHRVLVKQAGSTLVTIAKDVKIQIEFNPKTVKAYRLIGYENRMLKKEDFNDDRKDAGEIGAGHSVTAIYEIVPAGTELDRPSVDPLKYADPAPAQPPRVATKGKFDDELLTVKLRYKAPSGDVSTPTSQAMLDRPQPIGANLGFASAVAEAGMLLRNSSQGKNASYASAIARARKFRGEDAEGYRAEFIRLMEVAATLPRLERTSQ
jgi:Ca-activated chloride channel homolog